MSGKHRYNVTNRDPDKVGRLREVLDRLYDQELVNLQQIASEPVNTPYRVDPKDTRAGEKWLAQERGKEYHGAARDARIASKLRLIETILDLTVTPQARADADEAHDEHTVESEKARLLLDGARGKLNPDLLKRLRAETNDAFNLPKPFGSDPDQDDDE